VNIIITMWPNIARPRCAGIKLIWGLLIVPWLNTFVVCSASITVAILVSLPKGTTIPLCGQYS
jgi:hypothetical protein